MKTLGALQLKCVKHFVGGISPKTVNCLFPLRQADQYNSRNTSQIEICNVETVNYCFESIKYLEPKIW